MEPPAQSAGFPAPDRPVASIVSDQFATEDQRERVGEAARAMDLLGIAPGMAVADIGAGRGYYTVRLAERVTPSGRVYANELFKGVLDALTKRVAADGFTNVTPIWGAPDDARLPAGSVDVALMVRMYHEIEQPYALTWRLHAALKPGGRVAIIEGDRRTDQHGTPPSLLRCELEAVGFQQVAFHREAAFGDGYLAVFAPAPGAPPEPAAIKPCASR